ncbi:hypothetical protein ACJRO7_023947 [Eucalyptus globulus]|uniref:Uncharacterized protein n=1 Tax=Eucalyptus globulus TaxID=34317 RepID=A0ABD3K711_EUCGL
MVNNPNEAPTDEFLEHLLDLLNFVVAEADLALIDRSGLFVNMATPMMMQLDSNDGSGRISTFSGWGGVAIGWGFHEAMFPLG